MLVNDISEILPKNHQFKLLFIRAEPKQCNPIIKHHSQHSNFEKSVESIKLKYFFLLIDVKHEVIVFGLEVYKYLEISKDKSIQYLFVSKIDTTGLLDTKLNVGNLVTKILRFLMDSSLHETSIKYRLKIKTSSTMKKINKLIDRPMSNYKTIDLPSQTKFKLSLFTKSSNQYFFPESSKNKHKHLIDGDQLLKWWIKTIDPLGFTGKKLLIPGSLSGSQYLLPGWTMGSVFGKDEKCVYNIPNFPDDPKTRFLEFLIIENRYKSNLSQFYEELGFRQEFRLGNVVGIIGCELDWKPVTNEQFNDFIQPITLTNKQYKKLLKLIKYEDFSIMDDIKLLTNLKLPFFLKLYNQKIDDQIIEGKFEYKAKTTVSEVKVNNLTGLVKRRKKQ